MSSVMGIISHRRLMELKNSEGMMPLVLEEIANNLYLAALSKVRSELLEERKGFCWQRLWVYNAEMARMDAKVMFADRDELVSHVKATRGNSRYIPLSDDEVNNLLFADRAYNAVKIAGDVVECFKDCNEVFAPQNVCREVSWVLQNAAQIRKFVNEVEAMHE